MSKISIILVLMGGFIFTSVCSAQEKAKEDLVYRGKWVTTDCFYPLDGIQTAVVTWISEGEWKARIFGIWAGKKYEYKITFTGTVNRLRGWTIIDGAYYQWTGTITQKKFKIQFTGDRYTGSFDLDRMKAKK